MQVPQTDQGDFSYGAAANDAAGVPLAMSIFADRSHLRGQIRDDAQAAGFSVRAEADLRALIDGDARPLGDVVIVDCPQVDAETLAALARLDLRVAHCGASLIVSTSVEALDPVFACMDGAEPQFLVDPTRADRVVALGQVLARSHNRRLRELSDDDRLMLLRLTEQVGQIADRLDRIEQGAPARNKQSSIESAFRFESPGNDFAGKGDEEERLVRAARPSLPDPRLVRRVIRNRQLRARFFDAELFADPAWDMLLDLTAARAEHLRVSVSSLCIASGVPPTTALRWIGQMTEAGLFRRVEDDTDRRRAFIALTDRAADAMARYFAEMGKGAAKLV